MQSIPAEDSQAGASGPRTPSDEDMQRARVYSLMGALLAAPPGADLLNRLRQIGDAVSDETGHSPDTPLATGWHALKAAATESNESALNDEFHELFMGIGRGELMPYASWYLTGFLMERPLAALRQDLKTLGFERRRDFLKLTVAAGSAFAVGGIADKTLAEAETKASPDASPPLKQGYRETAHIRAYYDKARF